jgi:hypothetical protein
VLGNDAVLLFQGHFTVLTLPRLKPWDS